MQTPEIFSSYIGQSLLYLRIFEDKLWYVG